MRARVHVCLLRSPCTCCRPVMLEEPRCRTTFSRTDSPAPVCVARAAVLHRTPRGCPAPSADRIASHPFSHSLALRMRCKTLLLQFVMRRWSEDHLLNTSGRSSVLQRTRGARERENGWDAMRSADGVEHQWGVWWRTTARAIHTGAGMSVLESVARHLGSSNRVGEYGDVVGRAANMDARAHEQGKSVAEWSGSSMCLEV